MTHPKNPLQFLAIFSVSVALTWLLDRESRFLQNQYSLSPDCFVALTIWLATASSPYITVSQTVIVLAALKQNPLDGDFMLRAAGQGLEPR